MKARMGAKGRSIFGRDGGIWRRRAPAFARKGAGRLVTGRRRLFGMQVPMAEGLSAKNRRFICPNRHPFCPTRRPDGATGRLDRPNRQPDGATGGLFLPTRRLDGANRQPDGPSERLDGPSGRLFSTSRRPIGPSGRVFGASGGIVGANFPTGRRRTRKCGRRNIGCAITSLPNSETVESRCRCVAERQDAGSRGLQPTDGLRCGARRGATLAQRDVLACVAPRHSPLHTLTVG